MSVADFMRACLHDPEFGYYAVHPALGAQGDFLTSPMVSQIFGELIGVWALEIWRQLGRPEHFLLVELGPGDGTLMSDVLRAARLVPEFAAAAELWLVELSAPLQARQQQVLHLNGPHWVADLEGVPSQGPVILLANELLDCLPARQFVKTLKGWSEKVVGLSEDQLCFGLTLAPEALIPQELRDVPLGEVIEISIPQEALGREIGERLKVQTGAALFIDYGKERPGGGDTLQALYRHRKVDPLITAGKADLTVHADFPAFAAAARRSGSEVTPILSQGAFLRNLGLEARVKALTRARPDQAGVLARQAHRLSADDEMGRLFKVVAVYSHGLEPPGFEPQEHEEESGLS